MPERLKFVLNNNFDSLVKIIAVNIDFYLANPVGKTLFVNNYGTQIMVGKHLSHQFRFKKVWGGINLNPTLFHRYC